MRRCWVVAALVASAASGLAEAGAPTPRAAMEAYLVDELGGARLDGARWRRFMADRVVAGDGYDEPGWDQVELVSSAHVDGVRCRDARWCTAEVRFVLVATRGLASSPSHAVSHPEGGELRERYVLIQAGDGWRVATWPHAEPLPRPRVTLKALPQ